MRLDRIVERAALQKPVVARRDDVYGIVPGITPTTSVPLPTSQIPSRQETDLACIKRLAELAQTFPRALASRVVADAHEARVAGIIAVCDEVISFAGPSQELVQQVILS